MRHINFTIMTVAIIALASSAGASVLYDGAMNTLPAAQDWLYATDPVIGASATQSAGGGVTTLDTTPDVLDHAGYFAGTTHPGLTALDRTGDGFTLSFTLALLSELHVSNDRAGLSILVLTSDLQAIELGFWADSVWAQSTAFTRAETTAPGFTTTATTDYDLAILDGNYNLYANDVWILGGALRNYSASAHPIYGLTDLIFLGDDTTSAQATFELGYVELLDEAIPEPATMSLLALGSVALIRRRRN